MIHAVNSLCVSSVHPFLAHLTVQEVIAPLPIPGGVMEGKGECSFSASQSIKKYRSDNSEFV